MKPQLGAMARIALTIGCNLQKDQPLVIAAPEEARPLIEALEAEALNMGPREVLHTPINTQGLVDALQDGEGAPAPTSADQAAVRLLAAGAARVTIFAPRPDLLQGITPKRLIHLHGLMAEAERRASSALEGIRVSETALPFATLAWAKCVYPDLASDVALERLWQALFHAMLLDHDAPEAHWDARGKMVTRLVLKLVGCQFQRITLRGTTTNLELAGPASGNWFGGQQFASNGAAFFAALPFGGIGFDLAAKGTSGSVHINRPLTLAGKIVQGLDLEIKDGLVTLKQANQGQDVFQDFLDHSVRTRRLAACSFAVHATTRDGSTLPLCNPTLDHASAHGLVLTDPTSPNSLRFDLFYDDPTLRIEAVTRSGESIHLEGVLQSQKAATTFLDNTSSPKLQSSSKVLFDRLQEGLKLVENGQKVDGIAHLEETVRLTTQSYQRDALKQPSDLVINWRISLQSIIKKAREAIENATNSIN